MYVFDVYCKLDWDGTGALGTRSGRARDFVNFRKKIHASRARAAWPRGSEGTTTGSDHDRTLPLVVLGGIIENPNSDFVMT